jgi:uncharacterized protein YqfA (UPF0365 family)
MSTLIILLIAAVAIALAIALAWLPMRLLLLAMARRVTEPIREYIARQRDRRRSERETPDRRNVAP